MPKPMKLDTYFCRRCNRQHTYGDMLCGNNVPMCCVCKKKRAAHIQGDILNAGACSVPRCIIARMRECV